MLGYSLPHVLSPVYSSHLFTPPQLLHFYFLSAYLARAWGIQKEETGPVPSLGGFQSSEPMNYSEGL